MVRINAMTSTIWIIFSVVGVITGPSFCKFLSFLIAKQNYNTLLINISKYDKAKSRETGLGFMRAEAALEHAAYASLDCRAFESHLAKPDVIQGLNPLTPSVDLRAVDVAGGHGVFEK